jgi:phosphonate transport system substrate-binding protein
MEAFLKTQRRITWFIVCLIGAVVLVGAALLWRPRTLSIRPADDDTAEIAATGDAAGSVPIRMAMSAAFVSESGVGVYEDIANYLTSKTGVKIEFVTSLAYGTINGMLESGTVDCGFICGLPYVMLHDRPAPAANLIVAPVMSAPRYNGQPKYYSDLIVRNDSPYKTIHDLKGRTYVYNDEISNSGYNMPRYRLLQLGLTGGFFGKVLRSGSHEESIRMVAAGQADASFVDSLVLDYDREKGLGHAHEVRVLESVGPAGICPLAASSKLPVSMRDKLRHYLSNMHADPEGKQILDKALLARFVVVDESNYDDIRAMRDAAEKAGFTVIK